MFKQGLSKYFEWKFYKRVLIFSIVFAILFAGIDLFANGTINLFFPDEEVYSHFEDLARHIIDHQDFSILEKSEFVKDYTIIHDEEQNLLTVTIYGYNYECLKMVYSFPGPVLRLVKEFRNATDLIVLALVICILIYVVAGVLYSLAFNLVLSLIRRQLSFLNKNKR